MEEGMKQFFSRLVQRFKVGVSSETDFEVEYDFCPALVAYRSSISGE
ncbi:MAG: hypothetical protein RLZZ76_176 [Candidatus Parcubacteria bacterium]